MIAEIVKSARATRALERVRSLLADVYTPEGVKIWLTAHNRHLGHRSPLEQILDGYGDLVVAEGERLASL